MGCSESKIKNLEALNRCKERKKSMKLSVSARNTFAAAHFGYGVALNNTGAALSNYAQAEFQFPNGSSPPLHPPYGPPPLPSPPPPESDMVLAWDFFCTLMADDRGLNSAILDDESKTTSESVVIPSEVAKNHSKHVRGGVGCGGVVESGEEPPPSFENLKLLKVFTNLDDCFIKASESTHEVSKILEAIKLHHHSYFAKNQGHIGHSTRRIRVITWNKSFKGPKIAIDFSSKEKETHATLLHKMLVLEKKLYDQVKATEMMKHEYQKKIALLDKLRRQGTSRNTLERTQAIVNHLQTRYIVDVQSIDTTVSAIDRLRDEQLYPKLVQLIEEMGIMWENMQKQHENQMVTMHALQSIKIPQSRMETNEYDMKHTQQIHIHVKIWCSEFENLILYQKEYIKSLNNWLKVNLISIDNKTNTQRPKIYSLLRIWQDQLETLPQDQVKTAINNFVGITDAFVTEQMVQKERCEKTQRELMRISRKFEEWCDKQMAKGTSIDEMDLEVMAEHHIVVEEFRQRLVEEEAIYRRLCVQVKHKAVMNLKTGLPEVFATMAKFACASAHMYGSLKSFNQFQFEHTP